MSYFSSFSGGKSSKTKQNNNQNKQTKNNNNNNNKKTRGCKELVPLTLIYNFSIYSHFRLSHATREHTT